MAAKQQDQDTTKLWSMIRDIRICMMTTMDADGTLRSRPMGNVQTGQTEFDGVLWFFTRASAHKNFEIAEHKQINLAYASPGDRHYVSVSGRASLVRDKNKAEQLWGDPVRAWFPNGKDDPEIALVRVRPERAEYWDSPSSTIVHMYGYAKAALTGKPPHPGDNAKVDLETAR